MATPSEETLAALEKQNFQIRLLDLEKQLLIQKVQLDSLIGERDKALRWGIIFLGTLLISMGTWIVTLITSGRIK